jgi:integrase
MITKVYEWRDGRRKTPRSADIGITVLRELLNFGRPRVGSTVDITQGIKPLYKPNARPEIIWTDPEIERFIKIAHEQGKPELADVLRLAALTGMRRSSLISVEKGHVRDQAIVHRARKVVRGHRRLVVIPTFKRLARLIHELRCSNRKPGVKVLLTNASGDRWDGDHLTHQFEIIRDLANIKHIDRDTPNRKPKVIKKTLHDVRGTFATRLMTETDLSDTQVAEIMGWDPRKVQNIRRAYVKHDAYMQALGARIQRQAA